MRPQPAGEATTGTHRQHDHIGGQGSPRCPDHPRPKHWTRRAILDMFMHPQPQAELRF